MVEENEGQGGAALCDEFLSGLWGQEVDVESITMFC
jgi:hypothetical protein